MNKHLIVVPLVLLFCFTFACQDKAATAELKQFRAAAVVEAQGKALAYRWVEEINKRRSVDVLDEYLYSDYVWHLPGQDIRGVAEVKKVFGQGFSLYPDYHLTAEDVIAKGDKLIIRWTWQGTNKETGKKERSVSITIDRIANGKFMEGWEIGGGGRWAGKEE